MANLNDLEAAIRSLFSQGHQPTAVDPLTLSTASKAYEAYIFGLCLRAVRELGVTPTLRGISAMPSPFIFRGSPGQIWSTHRNYGYAFFTLKNSSFEIHPGVEILGSSGMTHEIDVCILRSDDAEKARRERRNPTSAGLVAGWECKFYSTPLQKHLARAFVGLVDDMGTNARLTGFCSNFTHPQISDYFQLNRRPYPHLELTPLDPKRENGFVGHLATELKKMAGL